MPVRILLFILLSSFYCQAQVVEEIVVSYQYGDEPPTKKPKAIYKLIFQRGDNGDFKLNKLIKNTKKINYKKLDKTISFDKNKVKNVTNWFKEDKTSFLISELDVDYQRLNEVLAQSYELYFIGQVNAKTIIKVDSFEYCKQFSQIKTHVIGGDQLSVTFKSKNGKSKQLNFDTGEFNSNDFNWKDYYTLCYLLKDKLTYAFIRDNIFSEKHILDALFRHLKMIECEDYYYDEFVKSQPQRTKQENRTKKGWDFKKYMAQRNKVEDKN